MTTDHQMAMLSAVQPEVIAALRGIDEPDLADRVERCMKARRNRRGGDGWPFPCRSAEAAMSSLAIIPLHLVGGKVGLGDRHGRA